MQRIITKLARETTSFRSYYPSIISAAFVRSTKTSNVNIASETTTTTWFKNRQEARFQESIKLIDSSVLDVEKYRELLKRIYEGDWAELRFILGQMKLKTSEKHVLIQFSEYLLLCEESCKTHVPGLFALLCVGSGVFMQPLILVIGCPMKWSYEILFLNRAAQSTRRDILESCKKVIEQEDQNK